MRYGRLKEIYRYNCSEWDMYGNIGDCIQNLAVENIYTLLGIKPDELVQINRDEISQYSGEKVLLPMQGWFGNLYGVFPAGWSESIIPVFLGYHLNTASNGREIFLQKGIDKLIKDYEPVGCRDYNTVKFFKNTDVNAYFSGCLTLTFPERKTEPENGKVFLVDLTPAAKEVIPENIKMTADYSITHRYKFKNYPINDEEGIEFENCARSILKRYRDEAKLVITSRIHCAMPCAAMGIPVIFINEDIDNPRFDVLDGIIPCYTPGDKINWEPLSVDISDLKSAIISNALMRITLTARKYGIQTKKMYNYSAGEIKRIENNLKNITFRKRFIPGMKRKKRLIFKLFRFYINQ